MAAKARKAPTPAVGQIRLTMTVSIGRVLKYGQPLHWIAAHLFDHPMQLRDGRRTARDHFELRPKALEIELTDDAVVALLDQELTGPGSQLLFDQLEFPF